MPITLKISPEQMQQLFPEAKDGDSFETSVSGTFRTVDGQLEPYIEQVEGQPIAGGEDPQEEQGEPMGQSEQSEGESDAGGMPMDPNRDKAKEALIIGLGKLQGGKPKSKYM